MKSSTVLGVTFQEETVESVIAQVKNCWQQNTRLRIATVNPEFLVATEKSYELKNNLENAEVRVVDGVGLWAVLKSKGWRGQRITGVALSEKLLAEAEKEKKSVHVILKKNGLTSVRKAKEALLKKYPNILLTVFSDTEATNADLTLLATGIPDQEYVAESFSRGVIMGVGGTIDFFTGAQKRAPKLLQTVGLEWLWRLLLRPRRFKRIWNAVIIFPLLVVLDKKRTGAA